MKTQRFEIGQTWDGHPIPGDEQAIIILSQTVDGGVDVEIDAPFHGDAPPESTPGPLWGLWEFEVVELFLVGADGHYLEAEFGPHGHHLVLQLSAPRELTARELPVTFHAAIDGDRWRGRARLESTLIPTPIVRANAFAIHGQGASRRYLTWSALPGPKPDFHQPHRFPDL